MGPGHREEDGGEGGGGEPGHQAAVGLAGARVAVSAGDPHQADQQGVEEGGDTLGCQGPPEGESPNHRSGINVIISCKNFSLEKGFLMDERIILYILIKPHQKSPVDHWSLSSMIIKSFSLKIPPMYEDQRSEGLGGYEAA